MPFDVEVNVAGLGELENRLRQLPEKLAQKVLVSAVRAGGRVIQRQAIANARAAFKKKTGRLARGILLDTKIFGRGVRGAVVRIRIGLRTRPGNESPWYGRLLESGWTHVGRAKRTTLGSLARGLFRRRGRGEARQRGKGKAIAGKKWMLRAFEQKGPEALQKITEAIRAGLEKVAN